jgi:hypothetical protein
VRVIGEIGYGVAFLNEALDFWGVEYSPARVRAERPLVLALEYSGCKEVVELVNGDFEYDICAIHGGAVLQRVSVANGVEAVDGTGAEERAASDEWREERRGI